MKLVLKIVMSCPLTGKCTCAFWWTSFAGVGRAIAESKVLPLVVPFWHLGIDEVLPNHPPYVPRFGKKITMLIGKPLDFKEVLSRLRREGRSPVS